MIEYATDETFQDMIAEGAVVVDFFGKTCGPCKLIGRILETIEDEMPFVNIVKVDVDDCPKTAEEFRVDGIPDLYFYKDGEIVRHELGAISEQELRTIIGELIY